MDTCIVCGGYVPEGRWVCIICEYKSRDSVKIIPGRGNLIRRDGYRASKKES